MIWNIGGIDHFLNIIHIIFENTINWPWFGFLGGSVPNKDIFIKSVDYSWLAGSQQFFIQIFTHFAILQLWYFTNFTNYGIITQLK